MGREQAAKAPSKVPTFESVQEEAAFWDSHGTEDFKEEWEPVEVETAPDFRSIRLLTVHLEYEAFKRLRELAQRQGIQPAQLAERWLLDAVARAADDTVDGTATNVSLTG